ncbi:histidine--tRNA ligase [Candidatus Nomurabacteria bacterium]|nr:histidine--tRNA ligase [Candidatus Nomurabacteria bacterium]
MSKKNTLSTESYKGVRDFYPEDQALLNYIIATWRTTAERWGFVEYHASILEPSELYKAKGADNEEIISEQTYTFEDRGGREVTLRPEMTPTVARMVAQRRRELGYPLRWYSIPNCFRYERPQRGRLREFWQFNADIFGSRSSASDAEIIAFAAALMRAFGATEGDFEIRIGSRTHLDEICQELGFDDAKKKALLALLDRKNKMPVADFARAAGDLGVPLSLLEGGKVPKEVAEALSFLEGLGVSNARYDPTIVRGFTYYTGIVFEIFDTHPDNNRAVMGGGRYDNLTELFGGDPLPGIGFAVSDEVMRIFMDVRGLIPQYLPPTKVYVAVAEESLAGEALQLANELRSAGIATAVDYGERKLGDQIKIASKHRIPFVIVVGQNEITSGTFSIKNLDTGEEVSYERSRLADFFNA